MDDSYPEFKLFLHLLLTVNHTETVWHGEKIQRGCRVTSLASLSVETGLSIQQIRTAIKHLKSTGEVTSVGRAKNTLFIVLNYDLYQGDNTITNNQVTNNQQTTNKQLTTNNNDKNEKNVKNDLKEEEVKEEERQDAAPPSSPTSLIESFESEFGRTLSQIEVQMICEWQKEFSNDIVMLALAEGVKNNVRDFRYIEVILNTWKGANVRTVEEAKHQIESRKSKSSNALLCQPNNKQLPEWFTNQDVVNQDTSDFDEEDMLKDLEELRHAGG